MVNSASIQKCIACGEHKNRFELIKIVNNNDQILIDPEIDFPGRSTFICPNPDCLEKARKEKSIEKAIKASNPDKVYKKLMEEINNE